MVGSKKLYQEIRKNQNVLQDSNALSGYYNSLKLFEKLLERFNDTSFFLEQIVSNNEPSPNKMVLDITKSEFNKNKEDLRKQLSSLMRTISLINNYDKKLLTLQELDVIKDINTNLKTELEQLQMKLFGKLDINEDFKKQLESYLSNGTNLIKENNPKIKEAEYVKNPRKLWNDFSSLEMDLSEILKSIDSGFKNLEAQISNDTVALEERKKSLNYICEKIIYNENLKEKLKEVVKIEQKVSSIENEYDTKIQKLSKKLSKIEKENNNLFITRRKINNEIFDLKQQIKNTKENEHLKIQIEKLLVTRKEIVDRRKEILKTLDMLNISNNNLQRDKKLLLAELNIERDFALPSIIKIKEKIHSEKEKLDKNLHTKYIIKDKLQKQINALTELNTALTSGKSWTSVSQSIINLNNLKNTVQDKNITKILIDMKKDFEETNKNFKSIPNEKIEKNISTLEKALFRLNVLEKIDTKKLVVEIKSKPESNLTMPLPPIPNFKKEVSPATPSSKVNVSISKNLTLDNNVTIPYKPQRNNSLNKKDTIKPMVSEKNGELSIDKNVVCYNGDFLPINYNEQPKQESESTLGFWGRIGLSVASLASFFTPFKIFGVIGLTALGYDYISSNLNPDEVVCENSTKVENADNHYDLMKKTIEQIKLDIENKKTQMLIAKTDSLYFYMQKLYSNSANLDSWKKLLCPTDNKLDIEKIEKCIDGLSSKIQASKSKNLNELPSVLNCKNKTSSKNDLVERINDSNLNIQRQKSNAITI